MDIYQQKIILAWINERWRGLLAVFLLGLLSRFLGSHYNAPVMLFALLIGMSMNFLIDHSPTRIGIDFAASTLLRLGVGLLGLQITFNQLISLGWQPIILVVFAVAFTIAASILLAKFMNLNLMLGILTGGATAICGASAALAIAAVLPQHPRKNKAILLTVILVSCLSTTAMILYPLIAKYLGLSALESGIFLGATIHDVAQVVGAGYGVSQQTGDYATIIKMLRVSLLIPVVFIIVLFKNKLVDSEEISSTNSTEDKKNLPMLPWFLVLFIILLIINSLNIIPTMLVSTVQQTSKYLLTFSMVAIGMKTQLREIFTVSWRPVLLIVLETIFLALIVLLAITLNWKSLVIY